MPRIWRGDLLRFLRALDNLDAAALAAAAGVDLRLDDADRATEPPAMAPASAADVVISPRGIGTPYGARIALPWYS